MTTTELQTDKRWFDVKLKMPPIKSDSRVMVRRKPDAALDGPYEWEMWGSDVRMHLDEVGWWRYV